MRKYPIGIQDFEKLRQEDYIYVDKTKLIHDLIHSGNYYFLSRPRRFGKSLLLSTIEYLFQGRKDLFKGLWIADHHQWRQHPVLHFSFGSLVDKATSFREALELDIVAKAEQYQIQLTDKGPSRNFQSLINQLNRLKGQVVILIDEYDKPLINFVDQPDLLKNNQDILESFFSMLKDSGHCIKFLLVSGVTKIGFYGLDHLRNFSPNPSGQSISGINYDEFETYFQQEIEEIASQLNETTKTVISKLRQWYGGYFWEDALQYNPYSILSFLKHREFQVYSTNQLPLSLKILKPLGNIPISDLSNKMVGRIILQFCSFEIWDLYFRLFHHGYLSIKKIDREYDLFTLGIPNEEIRHLIGDLITTHN